MPEIPLKEIPLKDLLSRVIEHEGPDVFVDYVRAVKSGSSGRTLTCKRLDLHDAVERTVRQKGLTHNAMELNAAIYNAENDPEGDDMALFEIDDNQSGPFPK